MRELKFRAWNKKGKCWITFGGVNYRYENGILDIVDSDNLIYEQYTGLKDKNGKEIYEGDIVKIYMSRKLVGVFIVQFDELNGEYVWCKNEDFDSAEYGGFPYWAKYRVIGNIHENPELLGGEE